MSIFGSNSHRGELTKKQAAQRNYFDMFGRHFGHIVGATLLYVFTNILFFGASFLLFTAYLGYDNFVIAVGSFLSGKSFHLPIVPFLPLMLTGPFTAGFTYVIRNYAKQEPTFLWSEFFEHTKKNIKQSLIASIISTLGIYLMLQALIVYNSMFMQNGLPLGTLYVIFVFVFSLFIIMFFYVYPMIVTFRMSMKTILKNAWTFTMMKLPQNLILLALLLAVNGGLFYVFIFKLYFPQIFALLVFLILPGFSSFTTNYYVWHVLEKHIIKYVTQTEKTEPIFTDEEHMDYDEIEDDYDETI